MEEFWGLILVLFFATNSLDKAESVQLEDLPLQAFDELFVDEWWDKDEAEDLKRPPTNFGQNVHLQIDRQNTQIGQIEPNSTDQLGQIEPNSTDELGQIEPNLTDHNPPPLAESDHSDNAKTIENIVEDEQKRIIVAKFHEMKDEFKQKGKYSAKEWNQIEDKIGKFDQMKAELKRDGFKNAYNHENDKIVAKKLGLSFRTISNWKRELSQITPNHKYPHSEQKKLMKLYYEIKGQNPKTSDENITKRLNINRATLVRWKKQFKRQQFHPNSVDGHSVEENAAANVQEIDKSNAGSI
uniref:Uncharacterized protein n=1 Tax=Globodera rostochiensis TaxID=31243 RepID=A0A914HPN0_GLORO